LLSAALLPASLSELVRGLLCALAHTLDGLTGALADLAERLIRALADTLHRLAGALAHVANRLSGALAELADALAGALADVLKRPLCALAHILDRIAGILERVAGASAHVPHGAPDASEQLRIAVQRQGHAVQDRAYVVEPGLQQSLRLDALDLELNLAEPDVGPDAELDHLANRCNNRNLGLQIVELEVDLVDLDDRDVDQDVRTFVDLARVGHRVVVVLRPRALHTRLPVRPT